jgi:hypothetical protein
MRILDANASTETPLSVSHGLPDISIFSDSTVIVVIIWKHGKAYKEGWHYGKVWYPIRFHTPKVGAKDWNFATFQVSLCFLRQRFGKATMCWYLGMQVLSQGHCRWCLYVVDTISGDGSFQHFSLTKNANGKCLKTISRSNITSRSTTCKTNKHLESCVYSFPLPNFGLGSCI